MLAAAPTPKQRVGARCRHYREDRSKTLATLVVTSRVADYDALKTSLHLRGAVLLQSLRPEQIDAYLASAGRQLAGARTALDADATLREMASSPLLLSTTFSLFARSKATAANGIPRASNRLTGR